MKQTIFIADGTTKIFHFSFPFFLKSDVIIEIDSQPATKYNLICNKNGLNADVPFSGGQVHFNKPPKTGCVITIRRNLPIKRIVDYQPTARYSPIAHNQDMNYLIEILKDMQNAVESVITAPSDGTNQQAIAIISQQIAQIISDMENLRDSIPEPCEPVDLSEINSAIAGLTNSISTLNTKCNQIEDQIENIPAPSLPDNMDYVVESQMPTAANNYTWYRKYASGWVEQGGETPKGTGGALVTFPISMTDTHYTVSCAIKRTDTVHSTGGFDRYPGAEDLTTTGFWLEQPSNNLYYTSWEVCGLAAE